MKTYKFFSVALMMCVLLVSCGSNYESLVEDFNMACEKGDKDKVVELKKELEFENAQSEIYEKKIDALINQATENELLTKVDSDIIDQFVKTSMGEIYEEDVVAYEKLVEKTIELLNETKEGSVSSLRKYIESKEKMDNAGVEFVKIVKYLQEPLAKRIEISSKKFAEAFDGVNSSIDKALAEEQQKQLKK